MANRDFSCPLHSAPPLGESPSEYCHPVWYGKTRKAELPDGEKSKDICNRLHTIPACDTQTERRTDILPRHSPRYIYIYIYIYIDYEIVHKVHNKKKMKKTRKK